MSKSHPILGIIGGMGPEATVEFMARLVKATPANDDVDHLHMIVDNNPKIPSRIAALIDGNGESPEPELVRMAKNLEAAGATCLAMPCNTAHGYAAAIKNAVTIPFINMIDETVRVVKGIPLGHASIGLLASSAVIKLGLYHKALAPLGITVIAPDMQDEMMNIIKSVKRGETGIEVRQQFAAISAHLIDQGADVLLIACTELSVLADSIDARIPVVDALNVLRGAVLTHAKEFEP